MHVLRGPCVLLPLSGACLYGIMERDESNDSIESEQETSEMLATFEACEHFTWDFAVSLSSIHFLQCGPQSQRVGQGASQDTSEQRCDESDWLMLANGSAMIRS
jgi:hypothetical protein